MTMVDQNVSVNDTPIISNTLAYALGHADMVTQHIHKR